MKTYFDMSIYICECFDEERCNDGEIGKVPGRPKWWWWWSRADEMVTTSVSDGMHAVERSASVDALRYSSASVSSSSSAAAAATGSSNLRCECIRTNIRICRMPHFGAILYEVIYLVVDYLSDRLVDWSLGWFKQQPVCLVVWLFGLLTA